MKKQKLLKQSITAILAFIAIGLFGQEKIELSPKDMTPADTGYYIGGVYKDKNNDGTDEFYYQCVDEYGDANHNESGIQQGFTYNRCMIMPTCWPKDAVTDNSLATIEHAEGYIQLTKTKYLGTDSAVMGYLISPQISNLDSMVIEVSTDAAASTSRHIYFDVEYSADGGTTWSGDDDIYIRDEGLTKKGDYCRYTSEDPDFGLAFGEFITASKANPIIIRIMTTDQSSTTSGSQRLNVHHVTIYATKATVAVKQVISKQPIINVTDNVITSESGRIIIYNTLGQYMGEGESVSVPDGIYIIRSANGGTAKVFVE